MREGRCKEIETGVMTWACGVKDSHSQREHGLVLIILYTRKRHMWLFTCNFKGSEVLVQGEWGARKGERVAPKLLGSWALSVIRVKFLTQGESSFWENGVIPSKLNTNVGFRNTLLLLTICSQQLHSALQQLGMMPQQTTQWQLNQSRDQQWV